ncbi:MAG: ATP-binding protein, partial [Gammaproteobacteria bacterium]
RHYAIGHHSYPLVAQIDIIDNGEGIPDDIREKIFLPMITGRAEGTGLGLSIAQSLIHQHGGLIDCQSEPGQTMFSLLIPLENGHE